MAKTADKAENGKDQENVKEGSTTATGTAEKTTTSSAVEQAADRQPVGQQQTQITIDDSAAIACYANFCRVSSSPEELILDLGLNPNPYGTNQSVKVSQRIILNHYTAKRLLSALSLAVQRHEQAFGVLETDVRKRMQGNVS